VIGKVNFDTEPLRAFIGEPSRGEPKWLHCEEVPESRRPPASVPGERKEPTPAPKSCGAPTCIFDDEEPGTSASPSLSQEAGVMLPEGSGSGSIKSGLHQPFEAWHGALLSGMPGEVGETHRFREALEPDHDGLGAPRSRAMQAEALR